MLRFKYSLGSVALLRRYLRHYPWSLRLHRAEWQQHGDQMKRIERACFDERMRSTDSDLMGLTNDPSAQVMVLSDADKVIGYIAGVPLESESSSFDPESDPREGWGEYDTLYIDNISILPEHRNQYNLEFTVDEFIRFGKSAGYKRATTHARKSNGLSAYCVRKLKFARLKTIKNWYDCGEDFDYLAFSNAESDKYQAIPIWHGLITSFRSSFAGTPTEQRFRRDTRFS